MDINQFIGEIKEIVDDEDADVAADTRLEDIENWDSLAQISFVAFIDKKFDKSISADALDACKTVADLHALI